MQVSLTCGCGRTPVPPTPSVTLEGAGFVLVPTPMVGPGVPLVGVAGSLLSSWRTLLDNEPDRQSAVDYISSRRPALLVGTRTL